MGNDIGKMQVMKRLMKDSFGMYKNNFKFYSWYIAANFLLGLILMIQQIYFPGANTVYYIGFFVNLLCVNIMSIIFVYFVHLKSKQEEASLSILLERVKTRFWKRVWTLFRCFLIIMGYALIGIIIATIIAGIIAFQCRSEMNNAQIMSYIYIGITIPLLLIIMIKYRFVAIIVVLESKDTEPFQLNKMILKGNYTYLFIPVLMQIGLFVIVVICNLLIKGLSLNFQFASQEFLSLITWIINPFLETLFVLLYGFLKSKYDEKCREALQAAPVIESADVLEDN